MLCFVYSTLLARWNSKHTTQMCRIFKRTKTKEQNTCFIEELPVWEIYLPT